MIMSKPEIDYVLRLENLISAQYQPWKSKELEDVPSTTYEVLIWLKTFNTSFRDTWRYMMFTISVNVI